MSLVSEIEDEGGMALEVNVSGAYNQKRANQERVVVVESMASSSRGGVSAPPVV